MAESLRGGLSLGLSGFGFWSHDIGGFEGMPNDELYKRWIAFGLLSSHSRLHGSSSYRVPWLFDEEAVAVLRHFTKLKCRQMPYLYTQALATVRTGVPIMRAMLVEFSTDPTCLYLDRQYMLGDNLLVAPVFAADGAVTYYVPAGRWTHFVTGEVKQGPAWVTENHDALSLPLLVRPGAVIAVGNNALRPDYPYASGVILRVYGLADGELQTVEIPTVDGDVAAIFTLQRVTTKITVTQAGRATDWAVLLVGIAAVDAVEGGVFETTADGMLIKASQADQVIITTAT